MPKYALDSNCYIDAAREPAARADLEAFVAREAPRLYLSAIVAAELRAGARTLRDRHEHVLLAWSCREAGVVLVTRNARDMERIRSVFQFESVAPYPALQ